MRETGVHHQAGGGRRDGRGGLPEGRDQLGDVLRLDCRRTGKASSGRFARQTNKYAGLMASEMKRLRELEQENARLKKIVADLSPDKEIV
jgi:hypothetical protein